MQTSLNIQDTFLLNSLDEILVWEFKNSKNFPFTPKFQKSDHKTSFMSNKLDLCHVSQTYQYHHLLVYKRRLNFFLNRHNNHPIYLSLSLSLCLPPPLNVLIPQLFE